MTSSRNGQDRKGYLVKETVKTHLNGLHHRAVNAHTRNQLQSIGNTRKQVEKHRLHDPDESSGHEMIKFLKIINFPNNVYADIAF